MGNRTRLALFLSTLLAILLVTEVFHHHEDTAYHGDCSLCVAAHTPFLAAVSAQDADPALPAVERISPCFLSAAPCKPDFSLPIIRSPTA